jgi:hypothetical protein
MSKKTLDDVAVAELLKTRIVPGCSTTKSLFVPSFGLEIPMGWLNVKFGNATSRGF